MIDFIDSNKFEVQQRKFGWVRVLCKQCNCYYTAGQIRKYTGYANSTATHKATEFCRIHKCDKPNEE